MVWLTPGGAVNITPPYRYTFYGKSLRKYTGWRTVDVTAGGQVWQMLNAKAYNLSTPVLQPESFVGEASFRARPAAGSAAISTPLIIVQQWLSIQNIMRGV